MFRIHAFILFIAVASVSCSNEPEVPQAVAVAVTAPIENPDKEVLVATQPPGAKILLKGAEVGETPMKLLVRGDTNIVLEKEGYVKQALMITPKSDPNFVVTLVPLEDEQVSPPTPTQQDEASQETQDSEEKDLSTTKTKKKAKSKETKAVEEGASSEEQQLVASDPVPASTSAEKKQTYTTMSQIKAAYKSGKISKDEYRQYQNDIRNKREAEYEAAQQAYSAGKLTKTQYKEKVRQIKIKYEG